MCNPKNFFLEIATQTKWSNWLMHEIESEHNCKVTPWDQFFIFMLLRIMSFSCFLWLSVKNRAELKNSAEVVKRDWNFYVVDLSKRTFYDQAVAKKVIKYVSLQHNFSVDVMSFRFRQQETWEIYIKNWDEEFCWR